MNIEINKFKNSNNSVKIDTLKFDGEMKDLEKIIDRLMGEETKKEAEVIKSDATIAWDEYWNTNLEKDDGKGSVLRNGGLIRFKNLGNLKYQLVINEVEQNMIIPAYMSEDGFRKFITVEIFSGVDNGTFVIKTEDDLVETKPKETKKQIGFDITNFCNKDLEEEGNLKSKIISICIEPVYKAYKAANSEIPYCERMKIYLMPNIPVEFINIGESYKQLMINNSKLLSLVVPSNISKQEFMTDFKTRIIEVLTEEVLF